jgi:AAA+ ATPase superfamily predicted ATPase
MDKIIGREDEKIKLNEAFKSKKAEFIVIYGRRRVGKTYLVRTFFTQKKCVLFHITGIKDGKLKDQLYEFTRILEATFYKSQISLKEPSNWTLAFELLTQILQQASPQQIVLFFDELPWLASQKSGFLQALDYYWNRFWVTMPHVKLIVCGSDASWMIENILHHKGGLHNRTTYRIPLVPFTLKETKKYLQSHGFSYTDRQISDLYMIMGGIPFYLNYLKKSYSVPQNIDQLFFNKKGPFVDEYNILYASLFHESEAHLEIIRILGMNRQGIEQSELLKQAKLSKEGGTFKKRVKELEASGFIIRYTPYGNKKRNTHLQIIDEYTLFYLAWVEPALGTILRIDRANGYWLEQSRSPSWKSWAGYAFESMCYKHIEQIRQALAINSSASIANWKYIPRKGSEEDGAQIDLLFDRNDDVITLCEMKYTTSPYKLLKGEANAIQNKVEVFRKQTRTTKQVTIALVVSQNIQETIYAKTLLIGVVTLKDLFR